MVLGGRRRYSKLDALYGRKQYRDEEELDEMSMLEAFEGLGYQRRDEEQFFDGRCWKGRNSDKTLPDHVAAAGEPEPVLLPTTMLRLKSLSVKRLPGGYVWMGAGRRANDSATKWFRRNEQGVLTTYLRAAGEPVAIPNASKHFARCLRQAEMVEQHATTFEANSRELLMLLEELLPERLAARNHGDQFTWDQLARDLNELCLYPSCLGDKVRLLDALHQAAQHRPLTNLTVQAVLQSIGASVAEINRLANAGNHRQSTALAASGIKRAANLLLAKPNQQ